MIEIKLKVSESSDGSVESAASYSYLNETAREVDQLDVLMALLEDSDNLVRATIQQAHRELKQVG